MTSSAQNDLKRRFERHYFETCRLCKSTDVTRVSKADGVEIWKCLHSRCGYTWNFTDSAKQKILSDWNLRQEPLIAVRQQ